MADTVTTTLGLTKPEVGASEDSWGEKINTNFDLVDDALDGTTAVSLDINGGTIDGAVIGGATPAAITGTAITGTSFATSGDFTFGDNDKAIFGAGSDLQIYHDGGNSFVDEVGDGRLYIRASDGIFMSTPSNALYLSTYDTGGVSLYHNGVKKFDTTSTGIDVTGGVTTDAYSYLNGLRISGADQSNTIYQPTGNMAITTQAGSLTMFAEANPIIFGISSTERMRIDSSGNVGIGTSSPAKQLHIESSTGGTLRLSSSDASVGAGESLGQIDWYSNDSSGSGSGVRAFVNVVENDGGLGRAYDMTFGTGQVATATERMRIDSSGEVYVGHTGGTAPWAMSGSQYGINLMGSGGFIGAARANAEPLLLNRTSSDGAILNFRKDGSTVGSIGSNAGIHLTMGNGDTGLLFNASTDKIHPWNMSTGGVRDNAVDLGVDASRFKDLYLSGGVYLGGTGAANKLDDYEIGGFDATLTPVTSGTIVLLSTEDKMAYLRVGDLVTITGRLRVSSSSSPTGSYLELTLPFAAKTGDNSQYRAGACSMFSADGSLSWSAMPIDLAENSTTALLYGMTVADIDNSYRFHFSFSYIAA